MISINPHIKVRVSGGLPPVEVQQLVDTDLQTTSKTVVGAINELRTNINSIDIPTVEALVYNADTHYDFPSVGSVNVLYKAQSEKLVYQWNPSDLKYEPLCETTVDVGSIELIDGGNATSDS